MVDYIHGRARAATVFELTLAWIWFPLRSPRFLRVLGGKGFLTAEFGERTAQDAEKFLATNRQTKSTFLDRIAIRFVSLMRAILPISCGLLRSWTVLPSGL